MAFAQNANGGSQYIMVHAMDLYGVAYTLQQGESQFAAEMLTELLKPPKERTLLPIRVRLRFEFRDI